MIHRDNAVEFILTECPLKHRISRIGTGSRISLFPHGLHGRLHDVNLFPSASPGFTTVRVQRRHCNSRIFDSSLNHGRIEQANGILHLFLGNIVAHLSHGDMTDDPRSEDIIHMIDLTGIPFEIQRFNHIRKFAAIMFTDCCLYCRFIYGCKQRSVNDMFPPQLDAQIDLSDTGTAAAGVNLSHGDLFRINILQIIKANGVIFKGNILFSGHAQIIDRLSDQCQRLPKHTLITQDQGVALILQIPLRSNFCNLFRTDASRIPQINSDGFLIHNVSLLFKMGAFIR